MEIYRQETEIRLMGIRVKGFPLGIKEAFDSLGKNLGTNRAYYGISWMGEKGEIIYFAMAEELIPGENQAHQYDLLTIEKGDYHVEVIHDWLSKTHLIKDVFHRMTLGLTPNKNHPCIEWYKSDEEMLCMIKVV